MNAEMTGTLATAIWLFPVAYMLHDLEEIVVWEAWMTKNSGALLARLPQMMARRIRPVIQTGTPQISLAIFFLFVLIVASSAAAFWGGIFQPLVFFGTLFFVHGVGHVAQTLVLKKYTPGVITAVLIVLPFGALFFPPLMAADLADWPVLIGYGAVGILVMMPLILAAQWLAGVLYPRLERLLVG
jgi:Protein of unknown function with HXXEE motif